MSALPTIEFDRGFQTVNRGILFDCPAELLSKNQMAFYQGCKSGWNRCPLGFWTYSIYDAIGRKIVLPGIIVPGETSPKRRFPDYGIKFTRQQIEDFVKPLIAMSEEVRSQRDTEFQNLTHDLRAMGAEIYNTALAARRQTEAIGKDDLTRAMDSVLAAQQMLSIRLDVVDYESGHAAGRPKQEIPVFKKIDKVLRCFQSSMYKKGIRSRIDGGSFSSVYGPPIFEIIPFVIMENAIKYSPSGSDIIVKFEESEDQIAVRFDSFGPAIKSSEKEKIFEQHFRGEAAEISETGGSGIGLYAAKTLVESQYNGKIFVHQFDECKKQGGNTFFLTRFTLIFDISQNTPVFQKRGVGKSRSLKLLFSR